MTKNGLVHPYPGQAHIPVYEDTGIINKPNFYLEDKDESNI